jgi:hypothetical protein
MAVAFDNTTFVSFVSTPSTSITTGAFPIGSGANMAAGLGLVVTENTLTSPTGSVGGVNGSVVPNSDSGTTVFGRSLMLSVAAPPSGSQTATMSWTGNINNATLGVVTASGVDQTTPMNNGNFSTGTTIGTSLTITSTNGDLTLDTAGTLSQQFTGGNQTAKWNDTVAAYGAGSIGPEPGTGTTTHTWTQTLAGTWTQSGANFKQAATEAIGSANITSSAGRFIGWTT